MVTGSDDQAYKLNTETGFINFKAEKLNSKNQQHKSISELSETGHSNPVVLLTNQHSLFDEHEADEAKSKGRGYTVRFSDTFVRCCKQMKIKAELHYKYREWLVDFHHNIHGGKLQIEDLSMEKDDHGVVPKLPSHWYLPYPTGSKWRYIRVRESDWEIEALHATIAETKMAEAVHQFKLRVSDDQDIRNRESDNSSILACSAISTTSICHAHLVKKKIKKKAATKTGKNPPKNTAEALARDDAVEWVKAMDLEIDGLTEMGVITHDHTLAHCRSEGILSTPVPLGLYYDEKLGQFGELLRRKARAAVMGHSGNMQKGIHFFETFAATPQGEMARILCVLAVKFNWSRRAWDVFKAYCWATIPKSERLILAYPDAYRRVHESTGESLFMILCKKLYGDPAAGRRWSIQRDCKLIMEFSKSPWQIRKLMASGWCRL